MWHVARCTLQLLQLGVAAVTAIMHKLNSHANLKKQATVFMATTSQCVSNPHRVTASSRVESDWAGGDYVGCAMGPRPVCTGRVVDCTKSLLVDFMAGARIIEIKVAGDSK